MQNSKSKSRKTDREKAYICLICGNKKITKRRSKVICCDKEMTSIEKGSWNL